MNDVFIKYDRPAIAAATWQAFGGIGDLPVWDHSGGIDALPQRCWLAADNLFGLTEPAALAAAPPVEGGDAFWRERHDYKIVADTMVAMQAEIERLTGARHSMYDGAIGIACQFVRDQPDAAPPPAPSDAVIEALRAVREWHSIRCDLAFDDARECSERGERIDEKRAMNRSNEHYSQIAIIDTALAATKEPRNPPKRKGVASEQGEAGAGVALDRERAVIGLETIRLELQSWIDFDAANRAKEGLSTSKETYIYGPPCWPSHGMLKEWVGLFAELEAALRPVSAVPGVVA